MEESRRTHISKLLSLVLRHQPEAIGVTLDAEGWVRIDELLNALHAHGTPLSRAELQEVVETNDKQRFRIDDAGERIRANQGHSIPVDLALTPREPPELLYHGTADRFLAGIRQHGLQKQSRQHVHLSPDEPTAHAVGRRHGKPVILRIRAGQMHRDGYPFFLSDNGVWLTEHVPAEYIESTADMA
ncbi:MAG: RNA 2'-phosphotransferase [Armatimonadota bacterium]